MRYIDLNRVLEHDEGPELVAQAESARQALLEETDAAERRELIRKQRETWAAFRPVFEDVFGATCWYTESHNPGADNDVDHYRPHGRVFEAKEHGGYWWEAFSWRNFRYSCQHANQLRRDGAQAKTLGKGDHFPLMDEAARWRDPTEQNRERPKILDPTSPVDPPMITFDQDGTVALRPSDSGSDTANARFEATREVLHLDAAKFVADRRARFAAVLGVVLEGDRIIQHGEPETQRDDLLEVARRLIRLADERLPYARATTCHICRFRDREWVEEMVVPYLRMTPRDD